MTSDRPIDTQQPYITETPSTWRVIFAPWMYIFRPGRAAETMVNARTSSFVISYLFGCGVFLCVSLFAIFIFEIIQSLANQQRIVGLADLTKSMHGTWNNWVTIGAFSRAVTNSALICMIAVVLNLLLAWFKWPSLFCANCQTRSYGRAFRCTAASLGFITLLVLATVNIFAAHLYACLSLNFSALYRRYSHTQGIGALLVFASLCLVLYWISKAEYHLVSTGDRIKLPPQCEGCGYDLTHQSSKGKCTECGLLLDESLSPDKRRTGCAWEAPYRSSTIAFIETTMDCLRRPEAFYGALKLHAPVEKAKKFVALHYVLLGIASASWIFFVGLLIVFEPSFIYLLQMAGLLLLLAPLLGWIGLHFVAAILTTWWMANRMLPDPSVVRKVLAYETSVLWLFFIFTTTLQTSYFGNGNWVSEFVGRKFFFGMPMELFVMFLGYVLLGILSFRRFHRALMAVRWANY